ncbi:hypothetical protein GJV85_11445 [Sulfurimonas aquatica]|uniref:Uncharacterized protein n=1 Tax=Sulfurimonas aquatica TaxID=2672570 RepID=A0A975GDV1_9BACT|nr:hypothetical protein [Sulfurimonas aquatica]QSZ42699.1 hypothetical protein GJV85_11445 [Sulfurimonas aquatica]
MKIFLMLFIALNLMAQNDYSLRIAHGNATESALGDVIIGKIGSHPEDLQVYSLDLGYLVKENVFEMPIDIYIKTGLSKYNEDKYKSIYGASIHIKAYYNLDFFSNRARFGISDGISYTHGILRTEYLEALQIDGKTSKYLNYLDISLDFDLGRLICFKPMYDTYFGWALKHRSGIFGLINGVTKGGSNYNTLYIEKNF